MLFIGRAQEKNTVFRTEKRRAADGRSYPWIVKTTSVVNQFYVHCVDEDFGAFFIKFSSYFPYGAKLLINGHHYAQARAARAGIGFTALDNGFAACDDVAGLQAICDSLTEDKIEALARKWLAILPNPYSPADQAAGYRYDISVLQAEFSLTQVLDKPVSGRIFFNQVLHDNLAIGRPDQVGLVFGRRIIRKGPHATPGRFDPGHHQGRHPQPARRLQELENKAVPQAGQGDQNGNDHQRDPRLRDRETADQPARTAADRLHRQPAPAGRPDTQP